MGSLASAVGFDGRGNGGVLSDDRSKVGISVRVGAGETVYFEGLWSSAFPPITMNLVLLSLIFMPEVRQKAVRMWIFCRALARDDASRIV